MEFKDDMTTGEVYDPAMLMTSEEDAWGYFEDLVAWTMRRTGMVRAEAEAQERANLGYYAGYCSAETARRVMRLFGAVHPVFGAPPDAE